jgi:glycosyl transferase family 25
MVPNAPPIFVISLQRATDRAVFVERTLDELGVAFEVLPAVDALELTTAQLAQYSSRRAMFEYGRELSRGELACALSHLRALEVMRERDLDRIVVLEDDTRPLPGFPDVVGLSATIAPEGSVVTFHSLFSGAAPVPVESTELPETYRLCRYLRTPMGTQAYLITRSAAARVLEVGFPIALPSDELLFRRRPSGLEVFGVEPSPVTHEAFPSEIRAATPPINQHAAISVGALRLVALAGRVRRRVDRTLNTRAKPRHEQVYGKPQ